jgi:hypothetical protein
MPIASALTPGLESIVSAPVEAASTDVLASTLDNEEALLVHCSSSSSRVERPRSPLAILASQAAHRATNDEALIQGGKKGSQSLVEVIGAGVQEEVENSAPVIPPNFALEQPLLEDIDMFAAGFDQHQQDYSAEDRPISPPLESCIDDVDKDADIQAETIAKQAEQALQTETERTPDLINNSSDSSIEDMPRARSSSVSHVCN